jgi:hypothetical protein
MKKILLCLIGVTFLLSSCLKRNLAPVSTSGIVISQITSNDLTLSADTSFPYARTVTNFTYNSKLLSAVSSKHTFNFKQDEILTNFTYNSSGQLKGTTISLSRGYQWLDDDITSSIVTYSGDHISTISFYQRNQLLNRTFTLTYENGLLTQLCDPNSIKITYTYDDKGNNTKELDEEYDNGQPDGKQIQVTNSAFDNNVNFSSVVPLWVYFKCYSIAQSFHTISDTRFDLYVLDESLTYAPGKNNPLSTCKNGDPFINSNSYGRQAPTPITYSYKFDANGYPTTITAANLFTNKYVYTTTQ